MEGTPSVFPPKYQRAISAPTTQQCLLHPQGASVFVGHSGMVAEWVQLLDLFPSIRNR